MGIEAGHDMSVTFGSPKSTCLLEGGVSFDPYPHEIQYITVYKMVHQERLDSENGRTCHRLTIDTPPGTQSKTPVAACIIPFLHGNPPPSAGL